jgi:hypothetical protein
MRTPSPLPTTTLLTMDPEYRLTPTVLLAMRQPVMAPPWVVIATPSVLTTTRSVYVFACPSPETIANSPLPSNTLDTTRSDAMTPPRLLRTNTLSKTAPPPCLPPM